MEGEICHKANREFGLTNINITESKKGTLPTATELRRALAEARGTDAMARIRALFDPKTFVELSAYTKRSFHEMGSAKDAELEGVICGYGAVGGHLVFAFAQDASRMKGALDARHAQKIVDLYDMAIKNGAPVVGIFDCAGADIFEGTDALAGYGRIMRAVASASGRVPQIAVVTGNCIGSFAAIAAMYDFVVRTAEGKLYVNSPALAGVDGATDALLSFTAADDGEALGYARKLLSYLPQNSGTGVTVEAATDDLNRILPELDLDADVHGLLGAIADCGDYAEVGSANAPVLVSALTSIGGVHCGVLACNYQENEGKLTAAAARKAARFVSLCDAFSLPVITLVNSTGFAVDAANECGFAAELGRLAMAYASSTNAKITVVLSHAIGGAYTLLGSKSVGADVAYAFERAEIGTLNAASAVAFALNEIISTEVSRKDLEEEWLAKLASPVAAASLGHIDDIITCAELRARIASALQLLAAKGTVAFSRHTVNPL
ncbi:MAG: hypothetical protein IKD11_02360 [Oscillospiraceae bacterium]|nr:hypothetical protein [Oscillospiraceae bacterium]